MKLPSNVILLVVEYLDWGTLRSLLATCRTIRLVLLTYQHSISKAWIARHLPNPAPPFTLIFSSRKEDPFTGGPAIINSPNFEAIEELDLRSRQIDALFTPRSANSPRGTGILLEVLRWIDCYRPQPGNRIPEVVGGLKEACHIINLLADSSTHALVYLEGPLTIRNEPFRGLTT